MPVLPLGDQHAHGYIHGDGVRSGWGALRLHCQEREAEGGGGKAILPADHFWSGLLSQTQCRP